MSDFEDDPKHFGKNHLPAELAAKLLEEQARPRLTVPERNAVLEAPVDRYARVTEALTPAQSECLAFLAEEGAEVVQVVAKVHRFGMGVNPWNGKHNREHLEREIADELGALVLADHAGLVNVGRVLQYLDEKFVKLRVNDGRIRHAKLPAATPSAYLHDYFALHTESVRTDPEPWSPEWISKHFEYVEVYLHVYEGLYAQDPEGRPIVAIPKGPDAPAIGRKIAVLSRATGMGARFVGPVDARGTAHYFRAVDRTGKALLQGTVGGRDSGADAIFDSVQLAPVAGQTLSVNLKITDAPP